MANIDKNIVITPNSGNADLPKIVFTGSNAVPITLSTLDDGTLNIEGSAGQLFSLSDSLTGSIFSVNDVSGIPSIEVFDDGKVILAEFTGGVQVGTSDTNTNTPPGIFLNRDGSIIQIINLPNTNQMYVENNINTAVTAQHQFRTNNVAKGTISWNNTNTTYGTTSDYRLKENIVPISNAIDRINLINPVNFDWTIDGSNTDGFIAHELATVIPVAVIGDKDDSDGAGAPIYQEVDQAKVVPLLTAALQEALAQIQALDDRITIGGL